jgi:polar amino acid transport system substrate-binding protein
VSTTQAYAAALSFVLAMIAMASAQALTLEEMRKEGHARIAVANEPPITEVKPDGTVTGAAVEIARAVLRKLGVPDISATVVPFNSMIPGLQAKRFDMITAGLKMRAQRCEAILFSEPDICDSQGLLVRKNNPKRITSYSDVVRLKAKIGVLPASDGQREARSAGVTDDMTMAVPDIQSGLKLVQDGRIDAYLLPVLSLEDLVRKAQDPSLEVIAPIGGSKINCAGVGFRKTDEALRGAYDVELKREKDSGEFDAIMQRFGLNPELAKRTTRTELCGGPN